MPTKPPVIHVLHPGLFTTVQDLGRCGYQRCGVSVSGAMEFLNAPRGRDILKNAASYVAHHFGAGHEAPSMSHIDRLADAITCIDYYLESVEIKKPAGERPFNVGERSLAELSAA